MARRFVAVPVSLALALAACGDSSPTTLSKKTYAVTGHVALEGYPSGEKVKVTLTGPVAASAEADADGRFEIHGLRRGSYMLSASEPSYTPVETSVYVGLAAETDVGLVTLGQLKSLLAGNALAETPDDDGKTVRRRGGVSVRVTPIKNSRGEPVPPETESQTTVSADDGAYTFVALPPGTYTVVGEYPGAASQTSTLTVKDGKAVRADDMVLHPLTGFFEIVGTVGGGAESTAYTRVPGVTLKLSGFNADKVQIGRSPDGTVAGCVFQPAATYAALATYVLPSEGVNTVCVKYLASDGRVAEPLLRSIVYDATPPANPFLSLNNSRAYSTSPQVTANFNAAETLAGLATVELADNAAFTGAASYSYVPSLVVGLPSGEGDTTLWARYADRAGNFSAPVSATVTVDTLTPTVTLFQVQDAGGTALATAKSGTVAAKLIAADASPLEMQLSNRSDFAGAAWQPYQLLTAWSLALPTNPAGESRTVYARVRDAAGNAAPAVSYALTIDTIGPTAPSLSLASSVVSTSTVTLTLSAANADFVELSEDPAFSAPTSRPMAATANFTVAAVDGVHTLYGRYRDASGLYSDTAVAVFVLDRTAPTGASVRIDDGASYVTNTLGGVSLSLAASDAAAGVAQMKVANVTSARKTCASALGAVNVETYAATKFWTLDSPGANLEGPRWVCAALRDAAGNWSVPVSDAVTYDTRGPVVAGGPAVTVADGSVYAVSPLVSVLLNADGASEMILADNAALAGAQWEPYRTVTSWYLGAAQGERSVYVKFRDAAGNQSPIFSDSVTLDTMAPSLGTLRINAGAAYATDEHVTLALAALDAARVRVLNQDGSWAEYPMQATLPWVLPGADGLKQVKAVFVDAAGNESDEVSAFIVLDRVAPRDAAVVINAGAEFTNDPNGLVHVELDASGAASFYWSPVTCATGGELRSYVGTSSYVLGTAQGLRRLYVTYFDEAGNASACVSAAITVDTFIDAAGFSVAVTGPEGVPGKTASQLVWLQLSGASGDIDEVQFSNDVGFTGASWEAPANVRSWVVLPGDGVKMVNVRARDRAGNTSAPFVASIELRQTPPETPALQVGDTNGDGYALSTTTVELQWNVPSGAVELELERRVDEVELAYLPVGTFAAAVTGYVDAVPEAQQGYVRQYRIRAVDELGNRSGWTLGTAAQPIGFIDSVVSLRNAADEFTYYFPVPRGTFLFTGTLFYDNITGSSFQTVLPDSKPYFARGIDVSRQNERLVLTASNADNSVNGRSDFELGPQEVIVDTLPNDIIGELGPAAVGVDPQGKLHVAYYHVVKKWLYYASNVSGPWTTYAIDATGAAFSFAGGNAPLGLAVDPNGKVHISYYDSKNRRLRYATNVSGGWMLSDVDRSAAVGASSSISCDASGHVHIAYYDATNQDLKYANNVTGAWSISVLDQTPGADVGFEPSIALDLSGGVHVAYVDNSNRDMKYVHYKDGIATFQIPDAANSSADLRLPSLAVDQAGYVHIAYVDYTNNRVKYTTNGSGSWAPSIVESATMLAKVALVLDRLSFKPHVFFGPRHATNASGSWRSIPTYSGYASPVLSNRGAAADENGNFYVLAFFSSGGGAGGGGTLRIRATSLGPVMRDVVTVAAWTSANGFDIGFLPDGRALAGLGGANMTTPDSGQTWQCTLGYSIRTNGVWNYSAVDASDCWRTAMVVDRMGALHFTYGVYGNSGLRYATNKSGTWATTSVPNAEICAGGCAFGVDSLQQSHVAYLRSGVGLVYATNSGGTWSATVIDPIARPPSTAADSPYLDKHNRVLGAVVDSHDHVHIVYHDQRAGRLLYATNRSGAWNLQVIDSSGNVGGYIALATDAYDAAHVAYYDLVNQDLRYATNLAGTWRTEIVDSDGDEGRLSRIVVDSDHMVHIAYQRTYTTGRFLRYAVKDARNLERSWGIATLERCPEGDETLGWYQRITLALDPTGKPAVSCAGRFTMPYHYGFYQRYPAKTMQQVPYY